MRKIKYKLLLTQNKLHSGIIDNFFNIILEFEDTGPIIMSTLNCTGMEDSIFDCRTIPVGDGECTTYTSFEIACLGMNYIRPCSQLC